MFERIPVKNYYAPLAVMAELANMSRARLGSFSAEDCERFGIPSAWFFTQVNAEPYAQAVNAALRQLAEIELPEPGITPWISFNMPFPPPLAVLQDDGRLTQAPDFYRDKFMAALWDRDIRRVRICPVCGNVFIAFRKDASACRGACTITNNKRRFDSREARQHYRSSPA